jgi:hypothetical protein
MGRELTEQLHEAEQLLRKVSSWSEEEVGELPLFYRRKAKEFRSLLQPGEE